MPEQTVSVVIPAYNAAATIDATLLSVRRQTHQALEVVVVVDGATDDTATLARRHGAEDPRVRVLVMRNGGVAAARNAGARIATGAFIAPIDADDLWHPDKVRRQLAVFAAGGPRMGCVYSPFRVIDMEDAVIFTAPRPTFSGPLFLRSLYFNFVGNGSGLMIRREAFVDVGGYEPGLRAMGLEGAEDRLIQILIARRWLTGVAADYLVGYRRHRNAMSANFDRSLRSSMAALDIVARRHPETPPRHLRRARAVMQVRMALKRLRAAPGLSSRAALFYALRASRGLTRRFAPEPLLGASFLDCDPGQGPRPWSDGTLREVMRRLADEDRAFFHACAADPSQPAPEDATAAPVTPGAAMIAPPP